MTTTRAVYLAILAVLLSPMAANADLIVYTDQGAWESAVTGTILVEDFNSVPAGNLLTGTNAAGLLDIEVIGDPGEMKFSGTAFFGEVDKSTPDIGSPNLVFSQSIFAFGADWTSAASTAILMAIAGGDSIDFSVLGAPGDGFLGAISDTSFTMVKLQAFGPTNEHFFMDNLRFALSLAPSPIPEPGTLALLGLGLVGMAARRRKKV